MEKEPDAECGSSASCMSTGKSKLDTLAKDDLIKFAKKQMAAMQKLKSKCAGLEEKVEALKVNSEGEGGTSNDSVIQELTERMDAVLLEKAETQQMLVLLRKENETLKNQREESVEMVAVLQEKLHHAEIDHTEKIKHLEEQFKNSETKYREELEALKKISSENEEIQKHRLQEDFNVNIEAVRQEYEHKISDLEQNLELTRKELKTENEGLQETHHITLQIKQQEIENLQETISKLSKQHDDEVSYLEEQLEISAADFDMERERLLLVQEELSEQIALKESYLQDVQEEEEDHNRRTQKPLESMEALGSSDPENEMDRLRLAVQDLQSENTMLKEELTFLTNVKAALEGDLKHLKEEYSMEREELEFKINELQLTKEDGEICPEKEPEDVTTTIETISLEEHNQILQGLKESHKTEIKELEAHLVSSNEREKEVIAQEAQDLQNKCRVLSEEKNAVVDEYEHTKEILRNIELELGDRTSEFVKKYNAMKEQAAVSVQELEEKLREKDGLIEKLECTQMEMQETSEQKPQHEENIAPEDKDHVVMSDTKNLMTLEDIVIYIEKSQEECKHASVNTAWVTLEKLKDLSGALQGALDETKCLRSSEAELESQLSHEKDQLAKYLALSNEEKAELQREHQCASHERDALRKDLEISKEKLSEARKQVCSVLAQNYSVKLHEDEDISTLLEHLLSIVQEEKSTCIVLEEEKAKLEKDLGALSEERLDLKKVLEDSYRKLSETQKHVCEILGQHFSVNKVGEEDISVLLNQLLSSIHEEKKSYMMLNEEKIKLQGDLVNMVEERDELRRCVETHEGKLSDARKRVCEILEQNYAVNMDEQQDLSILLEHLLSRGQEGKSTFILSNEEKLRKSEKDLQSLSEERNDLKKVLEDGGKKFSETQKRVCEILEQHYAVNMVGEEDISVLLNHLLSSIHEEKKSYMELNEEKIKLQGDLVNMVKERDELRRCVETHEGKLCDARKSVCKVLEQNYSVNMDEQQDLSVLLEHLLSRGQEEKSTSIVSKEEKAKLEKDLQALLEERNNLRKVLEDRERKLSDTHKHVCEILEQHYAVNTLGEGDISVLLNHLLSSIHEEKKSYNEEKIKLQGDLVNMVEERDELRRCVETHEGKLCDARKSVCKVLEQNYSVNMDEAEDLSVLLEHLLSRGQEEKSTSIVSKEEKAKLEKDLQALLEERNNLRKVLEDCERKLSDAQKCVYEILEQHYAVNTVGEGDISVLLNHLLSSVHEEKKSYNEEKMKLQEDLVTVGEEKDHLKSCVETHERNLSDARNRVCEVLEQTYSVNMDEQQDLSVLLEHLLSRGQEEKSTSIVSKEEKAKLEKDLQALLEERNNLRKVLEDREKKLSDTHKHVCEILEQHYAVNTLGEGDISVLLNHLLSSIHEEKKSYNEEKMKLQGDLVIYERNLSDARKSVCKILEQNYSVNMEEEQDVSVLLDHLLSKVQEEKLLLAQQLDGKAVQHQQAELTDAGFLQTTSRNEVPSDTVNLQEDQNQQVEISGRMVSQEREEPAVEGGAQETDDMKSLQQKLSEKESIVAHLKEELSLLQESKLSTLNENMRQIEVFEKESKEKEERLNKFKAVAVKARKELDSSRKEASRLKEELEALRVEKDKMSDSMKAIIHGAESYKNLMIDYDKQTELLDKEKEKLGASEKLVVDLNKRLHVAVEQHQQLSSEREDLKAHIETLQSNVRQLEAQALEMHKLKSTVERDLEAERLLKEQKTKEHVCAVKEVEELHSILQKQKQHLQQTEQELEQLRKDAQQSTLLDMEMADYERLVKELNLQLSEKNRLLEEQERQTQAQREREEKLNQEIESLKSLVDVGEEKTAKVKQLLVKTKKDLADAKKEEASQMIVQSSLKGELESIQQQLENYKIQSSELTADRHRLQEQLKALNDQHQKSVTSYQTQVTTLQNDLSTTKADFESIKSEYNSYKVRVHNVLKQQKNKSSTQSDGDFSKPERENMETMLDQLRSKLQESQLNAQSCNAELQQLQTEYDTLLERHNKMLQQTIAKEAELRERLLSLHSENVALKSEHSQSVAQLTAQTETLRSSFREQLHHLQDEHRSTVETLQHQINSLESQLFQLQNEPVTSAAQQPSKKPQSDRKLADLPLFEMDMAREEGEGMETTEDESLSTAGTPPPSLEQLLTSPDPKHEPFVWQVEPTKEELTNKLSTATRSMEHMNSLLHESEATNAILMEQISLLKSEMRRLERNQEREKSVANLEYLKNVLLQFIFLRAGSEKQALLPVIHTMLQLSPEEKSKLSAIAHGEEEAAAPRGSGWTSYLHSWSGIR